MAPHPPKSRATNPSHSPPISSPLVYKSGSTKQRVFSAPCNKQSKETRIEANRRTLEKRSTSGSKKGPSVCVSSKGSTGGCSISSLVRAADVPDDMLLDSNTCSFPTPGRDAEGRCDIGEDLSHHTIDAPNIVGDDVSIDNSQTRRGPNATKPRPVHPSQREEIWVIDTEFVDNPGVVRSISSMLKNSFHGPWHAWTDVDQDSRDVLWTRFKNVYRWDPCINEEVHGAWEAWLRKNFRDFMSDVRKYAKKEYTKVEGEAFDGENYSVLAPYGPVWIWDDYWQGLIKIWNGPQWREKSRKASQNRNTETDGSVGKHRCGSITMTQHRLNKEKETGGPVSFQVLFEDTHAQDGVYINKKAQKLGNAYKEKFLAKHGPDKTKHPAGDMDLWNECTGGKIKGRTFGTSSLSSDPHYVVTGMPSTRSSCNPHPHCGGSTSMSEVIRLEEKMELQKQEHVTREKALRKEFEDREAAINRQREEDRREWQDSLKEFQKIMLGRSSHSPST